MVAHRTRPPFRSSFTRFIAACIAALGFGSSAVSAKNVPIPELAAPITTLRLIGDETTLKLSNGTGPAQALEISTGTAVGCGLDAQVTQNGDTLEVHLTRSGLKTSWWCEPELHIAMPPDLGLKVEVIKLVADITGTFGAVDIASENSVVNFTGDASEFKLTGGKAISRLDFGPGTKRENVDVKVPLNLSHISFRAK
ncbi:hypothetical protein [Phaeobacter gallaeciensis]|uniref:DUF4402 domain-containing protein n=1 Tax=Phaeobacter gallaeciensis TaxID=60890 RepID=A0AAD0ED81_9RHOB|nr:hypothetical protein [Phaeobacter gallaeciensis]AHD09772.1 hypothetical protein Gal_02022 [Phaeobacter gallaeciensis DSM 26640]ATE93036.1 hypothetical protein PhaeoP11_02013 [Phaeobacter gallaeciensis]ATE97142.1 hypothetical protein PhaeoP73_01833 [Phaeobacter gallaeciensis]ATF01701.1 hypothetical protein PhaeoP75_02063 [Phaeobacter gallaeciensis]ATF06081.1 hypothetical protein PhaeoP63_02012 [Phaeobacter gallaeciensis]